MNKILIISSLLALVTCTPLAAQECADQGKAVEYMEASGKTLVATFETHRGLVMELFSDYDNNWVMLITDPAIGVSCVVSGGQAYTLNPELLGELL